MAEYVLGIFEQGLILQNSDLSLLFLLNFKDILIGISILALSAY